MSVTGSGSEKHHELHVEVFAPSIPEPKHFTFPSTETVGDAATKAATEFGLHPTAPSFEVEAFEAVLDRTKTLADAGVEDGWLLELVDVGGGV
jgi:hypothetical protein